MTELSNSPGDAGNPAGAAGSLDAIIRGRRTSKRLRDPDEARGNRAPLAEARRAELDAMLLVAGEAPFHRRAADEHRGGALGSAVPWRFHVLERPACLALLDAVEARAQADAGSKWARAWKSKIPELLAGASACVLATWLPDPVAAPSGDDSGTDDSARGDDSAHGDKGVPDFTERNVEHVAAAAAAVQNLLLGATARDWSSYWSSGGILKDDDVFALLGIPVREELLGAVMLGAPDAPRTRDIAGGLREERDDPSGWMRRVDSVANGRAAGLVGEIAAEPTTTSTA